MSLSVNWREFISSDPDVLVGKPVVKGTRLSVEFLLGLCSEGWSTQQILENYPTLTDRSLRAVFAYANESLQEESLYNLKLQSNQ